MRVITIGRSSSNDVIIGDAKVSRVHLQLVQNDKGEYSVVDLNSANGTYVNGKKISGEVRLQANDSIRIGDTVVEWQKLFLQSVSGTGNHTDNFPGSDNPIGVPKVKPQRPWLWIIICAVLLIAGGVWLYVSQAKKEQQRQETIRQEYEANEERLQLEVEQNEARRQQDKADDELYRQELREDRDKNKALAEEKQKDAENARRQAAEANKAKQEAEAARAQAENQTNEANKNKEAAEAARRQAESDADVFRKAAAEANQAKEEAEREYKLAMELSRKFTSKEYEIQNNKTASKVCEQLNKAVPKDKDAIAYLKELFYDSDNKGRQEILDAIKCVKQGKKEVEKADTSDVAATVPPSEEHNQ